MNKYIFKITIICLLIFAPSYVFSQVIDLIWLEINNIDSTIYYSQHKNNRWSAKQSVSTGDDIKLTPAIASSANKSIAAWVTSYHSVGLSLAYSIKPGKSWKTPQPIQFNFQETTGPALIAFNHQFFLFFAGNKNDDDDIYMSVLEKNRWSSPIMVHPDNSVPDLLPEPKIINGALTVVWQHFDGDRYVYKSQEVIPTTNSQNKQKKRKLNFQETSPKKAAKKELQPNNTKILKTKFNVTLPSDFKGVGLAKAYVQKDKKMPALYINLESN
ncbi:MAG: hypothetical protein ACI8ZB_001166 [Desulforhopalus sp.]|jgi:hypothetical protein